MDYGLTSKATTAWYECLILSIDFNTEAGCTLIKHDEENPSKPACLLRDSGRASFWPAEGSICYFHILPFLSIFFRDGSEFFFRIHDTWGLLVVMLTDYHKDFRI